MSGPLPELLRADAPQFVNLKNVEINRPGLHGQRHSRRSDSFGLSNRLIMEKPKGSKAEIDISAGQKMLSAVSGSLLTSLLGRVNHKRIVKIYC